jgi:hypothetical protein
MGQLNIPNRAIAEVERKCDHFMVLYPSRSLNFRQLWSIGTILQRKVEGFYAGGRREEKL